MKGPNSPLAAFAEPCFARSQRRRVVVDPHAVVEVRRVRDLDYVVEQAGVNARATSRTPIARRLPGLVSSRDERRCTEDFAICERSSRKVGSH